MQAIWNKIWERLFLIMTIFLFKYARKTCSFVFSVQNVATEDESNIQFKDRQWIFPSEHWCEVRDQDYSTLCTEDTSELHNAALLTAAWQVYVYLTCFPTHARKGMEGLGSKNLAYISAQSTQALGLYSQQWVCPVKQRFTRTATRRMW